MDSLANTRQANSSDARSGMSTQEIELVARADERLAHAYEQIAHADEQLARVNAQISRLEHDAARRPSSPNKPGRPSRGRPALRGFIALLLTAGICIAAFASQSYGETARLMIARWAPQSAAETPKLAAQPGEPAVQLAAADATISQLPTPTQTAPQDAAAAPIPPEAEQLLQTMARDLANVQQEIEQLKAGQEALTRENAGIAEQLKASQEQMARVIASASEQNKPRPRTAATTSANPPLPVAAPPRRPVSAPPPTQDRAAQARAPVQLQPRQQ